MKTRRRCEEKPKTHTGRKRLTVKGEGGRETKYFVTKSEREIENKGWDVSDEEIRKIG